jgi:hypothetical protein
MVNGNGILESLYDRLGSRAVLLPVPRGFKSPSRPQWQKTTFEDTEASYY